MPAADILSFDNLAIAVILLALGHEIWTRLSGARRGSQPEPVIVPLTDAVSDWIDEERMALRPESDARARISARMLPDYATAPALDLSYALGEGARVERMTLAALTDVQDLRAHAA